MDNATVPRSVPQQARTGAARQRRALRIILLAALCWAATVVLACLFGPFRIPVDDVLRALAELALPGALTGGAGPAPDATHMLVVTRIRLARVCLALLAGGGLAVAGTVFQGVLRNPLADPFTLGVSGGAAFGASLALTLGIGPLTAWLAMHLPALAGLSPQALLPLAALAGALASLGAVLLLGGAAGGGAFRRETVVLAGVVVSTVLSALVSLVKALDEESVSSIVFWIMGSLQGRGWTHAAVLLPWLALGLLLVLPRFRELDILALGDVQARQLGMDTARVRLQLLVGASLITAGCVAVSGVIGFVGLVVPHLARMRLGAAHGPLLAAGWFGGGMLLAWADVLARTLLPGGAELPVGVVTALLGGPFFCLLLVRGGGDGRGPATLPADHVPAPSPDVASAAASGPSPIRTPAGGAE
ncbi:iron ABC transporter permease [Nitratidesulfovibrio sp. HK-II]|uniref:FecCD family ABC transporter permease n=1 Tax=Nitratidesulfovibrio sp. HK-II TaxID=2009266 RepID=UPI000E2F3BC5|nr:iron ABC transporter permease [Nitratidesulfovibrio sp. HK-II]GBO97809.1 vitamin B12 ABC transporter [Nitratidesulfovibrio sp. HK-II]